MHSDPLSALLAGKKDASGNLVVATAAPASSPPQQKPIDIDDFFNVEGSLGGVQSSLSPTGGFTVIDSSNKAQSSDRAEVMIERALAPSSHVDFPAITEICERVRVEPREAAEAVHLLVSAAEVAPQNPPRRRLKAITILHELVYDELAAAELRAHPGARAALQELQQTRNSGLGEVPDQQLRMFAAEVERSCWNSAGPTSPASPLLGGGQPLQPGSPSQGPTRKRDKVFGWLQEVGSAAAAAAKSGAEVAASAGSAAVAAGGALMSSAAGGEDLVEPLSPGTTPSPVPNVQFEGMLAGECVYHVAKKADLLTVNPFCETSGRLLVTNFRLKFQIPRGKLREELQWMQERKIFDIPHGAVEDFKIDRQKAESGVEQFRLRVRTKDLRSLTFLLGDEQEGQQAWRLFLLFAHAHGSAEGLFAFAHAAKAEPTAAGPGAQGWSLYDPQAEYARMGVETRGAPSPNCPWILSDVNQRYELCSTYPAWIVVPRARKELETLQAVASFRKRGRIPVMSWCAGPELDFVSLWRSSQPTEGIMGQICEVDKGYVLSLKEGSKSPASSRDLLVVDLRPKKAAWANKANGGGFEDYDGCRLEFGGVGNIHAVRDAWNAMGQAVANTCRTEVGSWLKDVANSGWYDLMSMILRCASMVIEELQTHRCSTLIHCSDGWDRTAQVSSLAMLSMDPHYRTVSGFLLLVQKEFCSFGHQFRTRLGLGEKPTSEYSPIFPQWLECVYQLVEQFPEAFEFTPRLLLDVGVEALSNRYGTFLTDNERERNQRVKPHTLSCWSALAEEHGGANANPYFQRTEEALRPSFCQVDLKIWQEYWFRYHVL